MATAPTYPGVYIEEIPSGVRPITGVATSIAAFIGNFTRGPIDEVVQIFSLGDLERAYGGLRVDSLCYYNITQFFLNGGSQAWVARVQGANTEFANLTIGDRAGTEVFLVSARTPGTWGNNLRIQIDYGTATPAGSFNLVVSEVVDGAVAGTETFRNLTMNPADSTYAPDVVNDGSKLISLQPPLALNPEMPAPTGTISSAISGQLPAAADLAGAIEITAFGATAPDPLDPLADPVVLAGAPQTMAQLAAALQTAIRVANPAFSTISVTPQGSLATGAVLQVTGGGNDPAEIVQLAGPLALALGFETNPASTLQRNVQWYRPALAAAGKQLGGQLGTDGDLPDAADLIGALNRFDTVDLFNILCVPDTYRLDATESAATIAAATQYAADHRAFYVVDPPAALTEDFTEIQEWMEANGTLRDSNNTLYWPNVLVADPLNDFRLRAIPNSGTVAGIYARTDGERGVWKAPAGLDAKLVGAQGLRTNLDDPRTGVLNPLGINCLRTFDVVGNVVWGARTLVGADLLASEWKYVQVRRLALFLEESLYRGTQWVVFEPNDEGLWAQIRLNVGAFMQRLFVQGAFQGLTPKQAFLVKCDKETTTQIDSNLGIVNILVGFAPLKPAEFVIIKISQLAGQTS